MLFPIQVTYDTSSLQLKCRNGENDPLINSAHHQNMEQQTRSHSCLVAWGREFIWYCQCCSTTFNISRPIENVPKELQLSARKPFRKKKSPAIQICRTFWINYTDNGFYLKTILLSCTELVAPQNVHFITVNFRLSGSTPALSKSVRLFQLYSLQLWTSDFMSGRAITR